MYQLYQDYIKAFQEEDDPAKLEIQKIIRRINADKKWLNNIKKKADKNGFTLEEQLELERQLQIKASLTKDFKEGCAAFLNKRKANF